MKEALTSRNLFWEEIPGTLKPLLRINGQKLNYQKKHVLGVAGAIRITLL